jgi:hypothetical protein
MHGVTCQITKDYTMSGIENFLSLVREYVLLVDNADSISAYQLLSKCAMLLPKIYSLGLGLPDTEPKNDEIVTYERNSPIGVLGSKFGKYDIYWEVLDPVFKEEVGAGTLSEDLAEIYMELKGPLIAYEKGQEFDAIWQWKFNIKSHCGDHLVDALRTIHRLVNDHMDPDYRNE